MTSDAYQAERSRLLLAFGQKLRAERERQGLSQEHLAQLAGVHRTHLGALELGQREPHLTMLLILADTLGVEPSRLAGGLPVPRERRTSTREGAPLGATMRAWPT